MQVESALDKKPSSATEEWKQELLRSYSSVTDLFQHQLISPLEAHQLETLGDRFKVRITPYYAGLMQQSPQCPIRKQAIPDLGELDPELPLWAQNLSQDIYHRPMPWHGDAIGDIRKLAAPRLTHRYQNRAILHLSSMCAVYCRFCFRKSHLNDDEKTLYEGSLDPAFEYLQKNPEINELILTGGDPLSVTESVLNRIFEKVSQIAHIKTLRIHSRMAVTLPCRFTPSLLKLLGDSWNFSIVLVNHFNHPSELTPQAKSALFNLKRAGITLLNQSVLLRGVNDSVECLKSLFQKLYETGVVPFYLHHPDWTPGTFHFRISIENGRKLYSQLRGAISGPALPHYILDIPQGYGKTSLSDSSVEKVADFPNDETTLSQSEIRGAVYKVTPPSTRAGELKPLLYLDLFHD